MRPSTRDAITPLITKLHTSKVIERTHAHTTCGHDQTYAYHIVPPSSISDAGLLSTIAPDGLLKIMLLIFSLAGFFFASSPPSTAYVVHTLGCNSFALTFAASRSRLCRISRRRYLLQLVLKLLPLRSVSSGSSVLRDLRHWLEQRRHTRPWLEQLRPPAHRP